MDTARPMIYPLSKLEDAEAIVIHCSDPRFQEGFHQFLRNELGIANSIPIIVPGGVHDLVNPARIKAARQLWQQLEFAMQIGHIKRIVMFTHEDCRWHQRWSTLVSAKLGKDITSHLLSAAEMLAEKRFKVDIECYHAGIENDNIVFKRVDAQGR